MATDTTGVVLQANFKTPNGTLLNVYARTPDEFDAALDILADRIAKIAEVESLATAALHVANAMQVAPVAAVAAPTQTWGATPPAPPAQAFNPPPAAPPQQWGAPAAAPQAFDKPACQHGPRVGRSGQSAKGPWRAYFCPTPKDTPGQCEAEWVKQGSPAWNNFQEG